MKKLFISQPVRGKSEEEVLEARTNALIKAEEKLGEKVYVIDSYFENIPQGTKPLYLLSKAIELLSTADIAYFAEGWQEYRGCRIEHQCAEEYGIPIIE